MNLWIASSGVWALTALLCAVRLHDWLLAVFAVLGVVVALVGGIAA